MSEKYLINPQIRSNVFLTAHPKGMEEYVVRQINDAKNQFEITQVKNVLIIGGSSGYGLATRIVNAYNMGANTINVSYESRPRGKRSGTAGFWNNLFFRKHAKELETNHADFMMDAFSDETKRLVVDYIKSQDIKIDLLVYSLAAGVRPDENGDLVRSAIKPIGKDLTGKTIDIAKEQIEDITVTKASEEEIANTVYVMGGSDWQKWTTKLIANNLVSEGFKTISYTYVGGDTTIDIYRNGTIGKAKEDLEKTCNVLNQMLQSKYNGEALISSSKAVVTKASVFIPQMPIYVSALYDVMMKKGTHESILLHKYRLFKDMVYGNKRIVDDLGRIRIDHLEMDLDTQSKAIELMKNTKDEDLMNLDGTKEFLNDFYQINGFRFDNVNYDEEIALEELAEKLESENEIRT